MGFCVDVARLMLVAANIVFLLLGLIAALLGLILRYGETLYEPYLDVGIKKLQTCLQDTNLSNFDVGSIDIQEILSGLAIGLILGGMFLSIVAFLGCCGACAKAKNLLLMYAAIMLLIMVAEVAAIGVLYVSPDIVKKKLRTDLEDFAGLGSSEIFSVAWNVVMIQFRCCGVNSYLDFDTSSNSKWNILIVGGNNYTLTTPMACCKDLPTSLTLDNCALNPVSTNTSNYDKGCYDTIWGHSFGNTLITVPILVFCAIIQIAFLISAIVIAKSRNKRDKVRPFDR